MKTVLTFDARGAVPLPPRFQNEDTRFSDSFAEYFIENFSEPGDTVFDPFAGFGTTLRAAEKLGRRALGVELLPERAAYIQTILKYPKGVICGGSLKLAGMSLPEMDFVLTSPPYMNKWNHPQYPFAGYRITGQSYEDYLRDMADVFRQIKSRLKDGAFAVMEIGNLAADEGFTPLAWDAARKVGEILTLKQEIIIEWQNGASPAYGFGYDHSYALIFQNGSRNTLGTVKQ